VLLPVCNRAGPTKQDTNRPLLRLSKLLKQVDNKLAQETAVSLEKRSTIR